MVQRKVKWSLNAINDKLTIYEYWNNRNGSILYAKKLELHFSDNVSVLRKYPESGRQTDEKDIWYKVVKDYKLFYRISSEYVEIIRIWDSRRAPQNLKL
jgi:plasmid stabilization system protein ParE